MFLNQSKNIIKITLWYKNKSGRNRKEKATISDLGFKMTFSHYCSFMNHLSGWYLCVVPKGWAVISCQNVAWTPVKWQDIIHSSSSAINLESQFNLKLFIELLICARHRNHKGKQRTVRDLVAFHSDRTETCFKTKAKQTGWQAKPT